MEKGGWLRTFLPPNRYCEIKVYEIKLGPRTIPWDVTTCIRSWPTYFIEETKEGFSGPGLASSISPFESNL